MPRGTISLDSHSTRVSTPAHKRSRLRERVVPYLFLAPALVFLSVVFAFPLVRIFTMSFYRISVGKSTFVGFGNYVSAINDRVVQEALGNNALLLITIPLLIGLSLLLSAILFESFRGSRFYRTMVFFPYVLSTVVVGVVFTYLLRWDGLVNFTLRSAGMAVLAKDWLGSPSLAIYSVMVVIVWKELGFGVMLFLAALTSLDPQISEAAKVDGASWLQTFIRITVPQLGSIIAFYAVFLVIQMFSWVFNYVYTMTNGGPAHRTTVMELLIYRYATERSLPGMAAALSTILFLIVLAVVVLQLRFRLFGRAV